MKKHIKRFTSLVVAVLFFSLSLGGSGTGFLGVDVVSAASEQATPQPAPSTPKTSTQPKSQVSFETASEITRFLAFGSYGGDVKLLQEALNKHGYGLKVDGIFGNKTEAAVKDFQSKNGLVADGIVGPKTIAKLNIEAAKATETNETTEVKPAPADGKVSVKLGKVEYAAHGTKCFTIAAVALVDDKIVDAIVDDYQVGAASGNVGVPNSDADFGKNFAEGQVLYSKRANAATYSKNMAERAGSTIPVDKSLDAIQAYATGKTVAELEKILAETPADKMVDAVSGATLVDTHGYLSAILAAAKAAAPVKADAVASASLVTDEASLIRAMSKDGTWIILFENDFTTDKELVLEGEFINKEKLDRKIALYTQDENKNVTGSFTLTAPKLTVKSPNTRIQNGTFKGDLYIEAPNVQLRGAKIEGNVYFLNQESQDTFNMDENSSVTGVMELKAE